MNKYAYPAVFTPENNGAYSVNFPDFDGCYTCGDDLADAIYMAQDILAYTIYDLQAEDTPSAPFRSALNFCIHR